MAASAGGAAARSDAVMVVQTRRQVAVRSDGPLYDSPVSMERIYRCKTPANMARRAVYDDFHADTVTQFAFTDDPDHVVVEVDTNGKISPVTSKQVVLISVLPHHAMSQTVAERVWQLLDWDDLEGDDWIDPAEVDVEAKGWDCRMKIYY